MKRIFNISLILFLIAFTAGAQNYHIDVNQSVLKWNGKKVTGEHHGKIALKSGQLELKNDKIVNGEFIIAMNTITCEDLEGEWMEKLIGHLKSDDFFSVEKFPEAMLVIKESPQLADGKTKIKGDLTIKGITHPVTFDASQSGHTFKTMITVDRTLYNIRYGSGKFLENLGDKTIYDEFILDVELVATTN